MSILLRQGLAENIELLAAQRRLYSNSKRIIGVRMVISIPIAIVASIATIVMPSLKGYVALWGLIAIIVDIFLLDPWSKQLRETAAKIQEIFDTQVLSLEWNAIAAGKKPERELIHREAMKHGLDSEATSSLMNWYPVTIQSAPESFGKIICQRSNIWWDGKLRRKFVIIIKIFLSAVAVAIIGFGVLMKIDTFDLLTRIFAPLSSTYVFGYRMMTEFRDSADRLDRLLDCCEKSWNDALSGVGDSILQANSRSLQDQIFEHRKRSPPVFDFIFNRFRGENDILMNKGAETLVSEFRRQTTAPT